MITVISCSNRKDNKCRIFAEHYAAVLRTKGDEPVELLVLEDIPHDWFFPEMYEGEDQAVSLAGIQDKYMLPADKFVFVSSEYNGSYPGALKLFIDAISVREYKATFKGKKAALVGVATGRAGNLRGMDHLTGVLNHVGTIVLPNKLPISKIGSLLSAEDKITDSDTLKAIEQQIDEFYAF
jgi:NAD(P)H-dependent FMN reductase